MRCTWSRLRFNFIQIGADFGWEISGAEIGEDKGAIVGGRIEVNAHKFRVIEGARALADKFKVVGVKPVAGIGDKTIFDGVDMDIAAEV